MLNRMVPIALLFVLWACEAPSLSEKPIEIDMAKEVDYPVFAGDRVEPVGPADIKVDHSLATNQKTVRLLSGSATLLRGDYRLGVEND